MKVIRMAPDYSCYPLWHDDGAQTGDFGDIDPRSLPITSELALDLVSWAERFDKDLNMDDPANSPGMSAVERNMFVVDGEKLLARLREELGPSYKVNRAF